MPEERPEGKQQRVPQNSPSCPLSLLASMALLGAFARQGLLYGIKLITFHPEELYKYLLHGLFQNCIFGVDAF